MEKAAKESKKMFSQFQQVQHDDDSRHTHECLVECCEHLLEVIEELEDGDAKHAARERLMETYMWACSSICESQQARSGS